MFTNGVVSEAKSAALRAMGSLLLRAKEALNKVGSMMISSPISRKDKDSKEGMEGFDEGKASVDERVTYWQQRFESNGLITKLLQPPAVNERSRVVSIRKLDENTKKKILKEKNDEKLRYVVYSDIIHCRCRRTCPYIPARMITPCGRLLLSTLIVIGVEALLSYSSYTVWEGRLTFIYVLFMLSILFM